MKNLNKVLAMLVVFMMVVTTVAFASFTDVADTSSYYTAIKVGTDLNLFKGYEDGTFAPEGEITRAEFAAIVVRMKGQEAQAEGAKASTMFVDVPADHWAAGYVNIAVQAGIINGYGNGNFGPEDLVEYQDAITMMVRALGYEPAIGSAGYPTGYLTKAGELGLTAGVNGTNGVAINRGAVAQITFNSLDVPLMTQSGYGTFTQYVINDGYSATTGDYNVKKTLLSENHNIVKVQGVISSSTDSTATSTTGVEKVYVNVTNALYNKFGVTTGSMFVGNSDAKDYVGKKVILFVHYDEFNDVSTVVSVYEAPVSDTLVVDIADIISFEDAFQGEIKYYNENDKTMTITAGSRIADYDENGKYAGLVNAAPNVYFNGVNINSVSNVDFIDDADPEAFREFSGTVEFALLNPKTTTKDYDTIYIDAAKVFVVDEVKTKSESITNKIEEFGEGSIEYNEEDGDISATLYGKDGAAMDWADLKEFDVLMLKYIETAKDIYVATLIDNKVEGKVAGLSGEQENGNRKVVIAGTTYDVAVSAEEANDLRLGDEGIFYLDANDNVVYFDATATISDNYGYVIKVGIPEDEDLISEYQVKILTKDNNVVIYNMAKSFKWDDTLGVKIDTEKSTNLEKKILNETDFKAIEDTVITYKVNSADEISVIDNAADATDPEVDAEREFTTATAAGRIDLVDYDPDDMSFGTYNLKENTVIFLIAKDANDSEVVALPVLEEKDMFDDVELFNVDEDDYIGCIAIRGTESEIGGSSYNATFVTNVVEATDDDGDDVNIVEGYKDGEFVSYTCESEVATPELGTLVVPQYAVNGTVKAFYEADVEISEEKGRELTVADLKSIDKRTLTFKDDSTQKIKSGANVYVWDARKTGRNNYEVDASLGYIDYDEEKGLYIDKDNTKLDVTVYIYFEDGKTADVVYFINAD